MKQALEASPSPLKNKPMLSLLSFIDLPSGRKTKYTLVSIRSVDTKRTIFGKGPVCVIYGTCRQVHVSDSRFSSVVSDVDLLFLKQSDPVIDIVCVLLLRHGILTTAAC